MHGAIAERHNTADDRFLARPKGERHCPHCGVALLVKGGPFTVERALHCVQWRSLNVTGLAAGYTGIIPRGGRRLLSSRYAPAPHPIWQPHQICRDAGTIASG